MIGIFVDTSDLYHRVRRKFNCKLCYETYYDKASDLGDIHKAFAYGMQTEHEASGFMNCLRSIGFEVRFKRPKIMRIGDREIRRCDWSAGIAVDVFKTIARLDTVVLGSSNLDLIPLIEWIRDQGVRVVILASGVPRSLRDLVDDVIEITEDFLEEEDEDVCMS